jgi:hypothetical protein
MTTSVAVRVQDHSFFIGDRDAATPFDTMDYSTGIAGVMESAMLVAAGIDRGNVQVSVLATDHDPGLDQHWDDLAAWDDVAEVSLYCPRGALTVERLEYGPFDPRPDLPVLSAHGPGHYRLRIFASGRDRDFDKVVDASAERFHIVAWPAPSTASLIVKATTRCGYGLRMSTATSPSSAQPPPPDTQQAASHQAMLDRALRGE